MNNQLKEELISFNSDNNSEILQELYKKINESNSIISESNRIMEENKRINECFLEQKYQIDKIETLEKLLNKLNDSLISHEIRLANVGNELHSIKTKYDKIVLDNLLVPGFIGPSCQFKNLSAYIKNNISEFGKIRIEHQNIKKDTREFKIKLDGASKNILNLIDGGILRCNQYADNRINDFHVVLENKIKEMNDKNMEMRMKNIQYQTKIEEDINNLKINYEEKMVKQKEDLSQIINNKIEYLNINYSSLEKNLKILEIDDIKNNYLELTKEVKELKQYIQNLKSETYNNKNSNYNNNSSYNSNNYHIQIDNKLKKFNKRKSVVFKDNDNNLSKFYESINLNYDSKKKTNIKNANRFEIYGSSGKLVHVENNKNSELSAHNQKERKGLLSPVKSKFHKNNNQYTNSNKKSESKNYDDNNSINKNDTKRNMEIIPKKYSTKTNLINIKDKINSIENMSSDNYGENLNNKFNQINSNNIINNNSFQKNKAYNENFNSININNSNNINKIDISKTKNDHINNEDTHSFISISNSSKNESNEEVPNKALFLDINTKINNINNKNNINILEKKLSNKNTIQNKKEKSHPNKLKNLHIEISDNNESKTNSKVNFNKSQSNYKNEIIKELFTKYNKGNIATNLSLFKNKTNLDLYNYSISPPDKRFILNAKINEIIEPPLKELFYDKNGSNIYEKNARQYYTNRILTLKPSLNMQLFYGNYNEKRKEKNNKKLKSLSSSEQKMHLNPIVNQKKDKSKKINPSYGKTIHPEYIKTENLFTMTSYRIKNN